MKIDSFILHFFKINIIYIFQLRALKQQIIKKEVENDALAVSLKKVNQRLGIEIITDSEESDTTSDSDLSSSSNSTNIVNTRHYQLDAEFAKKYFFITDVSFNSFEENETILNDILYF